MKRAALIVLAAAVFVSAIEIVLAQHEARHLFVETQELESA
ncbi:MAG: cell division protein FtsL, partial [Gammaproteobacteria bacterium]